MTNDNLTRDLENLVKEVLKKQDRIIPIIGDDCFEGKGKENQRLPLQLWIAEEMLKDEFSSDAKKLIYEEGYRGLDVLYEKYIEINDEYNFVDYKEELIQCIENGIKDQRLFLRRDVKDFLQAGKFEVIATTCPYHILEKELTWKNYNVTSFAPISSRNNSNGSSKSESTLKLPAIYQIFGNCEGEFVAGEEDLLKFLHYLNQTDTEKGFGASPLVKYIKDKGQDNKGLGLLMPIGCSNLPDWLFRFLWYPFSQERIIGNDKNNQGGVWPNYSSNKNFYKFLRNYRFKTFSGSTDELKIDDGDPILERLTKEFHDRRNKVQKYASDELQVNWNDNDKWDVFISYAKENRTIAQKIYDVLTRQCHKDVWMDNRNNIKPGDDYWVAIQHGIEHSQRFLFIITNDYLEKAIDKNHKYDSGDIRPTGVYQEIERIKQHILTNKMDGQKGFCIPLIIEGTKVTYTDHDGILHEELLGNGVLEKLPKYKEYQMLQTDALFYQIQDIICNKDNLQQILTSIFN